MRFSTKMRSSYSKVTRLIQSNSNVFLLTGHKYEKSNVDFNLFLNCCKLGNCVISLTCVCIPLTVIDMCGVRFLT